MDRTRLPPPVFVPPVAAQLGSGPTLMDPVRAALAARRLRAGPPQYAGPAGPPVPPMLPAAPPLPFGPGMGGSLPSRISGPAPPPPVAQYLPGSAQGWGSLSPAERLGALRDAIAAQGGAPASPMTGPVADVAKAVGSPGVEWVGDIATAVPAAIQHPSVETVMGALGAAIPPPARPVLNNPREFVETKLGDLAYQAATGGDPPDWLANLPFGDTFYAAIQGLAADEGTRQKIIAAHDQGGGLGTFWGAVVDTSDMSPTMAFITQFAAAMLTDPWTYVPILAAGGKSIEEAGRMSALEKGGLAAATRGDTALIRAGQALQAPNVAANVVGGLPFELAGHGIGAARGRLGALNRAFSPSESALRQEATVHTEDLIDTAAAIPPDAPLVSAAAQAAPAPPPSPPTRAQAAPVKGYTVKREGVKTWKLLNRDTDQYVVENGKLVTFADYDEAARDAARRTADAQRPAEVAGTEPSGEYDVVQMGKNDFQVLDPSGKPVLNNTGTPLTFKTHRIAAADAQRRTARDALNVTTEPPADIVGPVTPPEAITEPVAEPVGPVTPTGPLREHWLNPETGRTVPYKDFNRPPSVPEFVAYELGQVDRPMAEAWWKHVEEDPRTADFVAEQEAFDRKPSPYGAGASGAQRDSAEKILSQARHEIEVQRQHLFDLLGDVSAATHVFRHGDELHSGIATAEQGGGRRGTVFKVTAAERGDVERNAVERAIFGTDEEAKAARQYLHVAAKTGTKAERERAARLLDGINDLRAKRLAQAAAGEAAPPVAADGVDRFQWKKNADDGQTYGNQMEVRPVTPEMRTTYGLGPGDGPDAVLVRVEGKGDWQLVTTGTRDDLIRETEASPGWAKRVASFEGEDARTWGNTADTPADGPRGEIPTAPRPNRLGIPELPGEIAPIEDSSTLGQAFNTGKIGAERYADLNRTLSIGGKPTRFIDVVHQALADNPDSRPDAMAQVRGVVAAADGLTAPDRGRLLRAIDTALATYRENVMFNAANIVRGPVSDQAGDMLAMGVTGHPDAAVASLSLRNAYRWVKYQRGAKRMIEQMPQVQRLNRFGVKVRRDLLEALQRSETDTSSEEMLLTAGAKKVPIAGRALSKITPIFASRLARDIRTALDHNRRLSLQLSVFLNQVPEARATLVGLARREGGDAMADTVRMLPEEFSPDDVLAATGSEQLARQWRGLVNKMDAAADAEQNRVLFSYRMTNLDAKLKYAIMFHYWLSRATLLHTKAAFQNPALMNAYLRGFDGLKQVAEEEGLPAPLRTYYKFMGDVGGWYALADPIGALLPYSIARDMFAGDDPEKERTFDKIVRKTGIFVSPMVEVAAAMLGATDKVPDPTATWAIRGYAKVFFDYARNHGVDFGTGPGITEDPVDRIERKFAETVADLAVWSGMVPFAKKLNAFDRVANEQTQVLDVLKTQMENEYGSLQSWDENRRREFLEAQTAIQFDRAEENPRAQAALAAWSAGKAGGKAAALVVPAGVQTFYGPRQQRIALKDEGYAALDANTEPTYEQQNAMTATQQINADNEPGAAQAVTEQDLYGKLGTPIEQDIVRNWNMLAHGTAQDFAKAGTNFVWSADGAFQYSVAQVLAMDEEERKALADGYLARNGYETQYKDLRDAQTAFKDKNPISGGYADWVKLGRDKEKFPGGIPEFRDLMMRKSESYRKYIGRLNPETRKDPAKFDRASTSMEAYLSLRGIEGSVYKDELGGDPAASADVDMWVKMLENTGGFGGDQKKYDLSTPEGQLRQLKDKIAEYEKKLRVYNNHVLPMSNGIPFEQLPPEFQGLVARRLQAQNIRRPAEPGIVNSYRMWQAIQPNPAAATPEAYVAWLAKYGQFDTAEEPAA